jgi:16S rRNA A1518/A1519 N6-dimethyltransferase RsmA/KsgA/DIM1 with predicted DNA glycosylase/AP lyase activity
VESSLVRLTRRDRLGEDARDFGVFVQKIFSSRRKTMRNALGKVCDDADQLLAATGISPTARPQEIDAMAIWKLFQKAKTK